MEVKGLMGEGVDLKWGRFKISLVYFLLCEFFLFFNGINKTTQTLMKSNDFKNFLCDLIARLLCYVILHFFWISNSHSEIFDQI